MLPGKGIVQFVAYLSRKSAVPIGTNGGNCYKDEIIEQSHGEKLDDMPSFVSQSVVVFGSIGTCKDDAERKSIAAHKGECDDRHLFIGEDMNAAFVFESLQ